MPVSLTPVSKIQGRVTLPGDKSISHRLAMLAALAEGTTRIANFAASRDCHSTLGCLEALGVPIIRGDGLEVEGQGLHGLKAPAKVLDAENSGTTLRLLAGILAGQPFESCLTGDASLRRRPMGRIMTPLEALGATMTATNGEFAPLTIKGGDLQAITYKLPVASAQVKSCVLLAGLFADGETSVIESVPTRDHTERMLAAFGVPVYTAAGRISVEPLPMLSPMFGAVVNYEEGVISVVGGEKLISPVEVCSVPGDFSSAAFFLAAALMVNEAELVLEGVGVNPTRTGFLSVLEQCGASFKLNNERQEMGEPVADIHISRSGKQNFERLDLSGDIIPNVIDELPMLAVLGAHLNGIDIRDAGELRVKESDRIHLVAENLRQMGAEVAEFEDGLSIEGHQRLQGAAIETGGDHRIAMAFSIAALVAKGTTEILDADCVGVSFPAFYNVLHELCGN